MPCFTQRFTNLLKTGPVIEITLLPAYSFLESLEIKAPVNNQVKILAMIDTGASGTVIQKGTSQTLELNPIGTTLMTTPSSTNILCNQFDVQLIFPNQVIIQNVVVTEAPLQNQHIQCLIGRDILKYGLLVYNGYDNSFTLSF